MSQIHAILSTLSASEHAKIKKLRVIGTERQIFDFHLEHRNKTLPDAKDICRALNITPNHYYKVCSVLLHKIYSHLVPEMGVKLLHFLNRKDLFNLLAHEMYMQEKDLSREKSDLNRLSDFYWNCFLILLRVSVRDFDEQLVLAYAEKYLKTKTHKEIHEDIMIRNMYITTMMMYLRATQKGKFRASILLEELIQNEQILLKSAHIMAKYYLHEAFKNYYTHLNFDVQKVLEYTEKNLVLMDQYPERFTPEQIATNRCKVAEMYFATNKPELAFQKYEEVFEKYTDALKGEYYHASKYVQTALAIEKFDRAKTLLDERFTHMLHNKKNTAAVISGILHTKYYLLINQFEEASHALNVAKAALKRNANEQLEIEVRILEIMLLLFNGKSPMALNQIRRAVKFMQTRGYGARTSIMYFMFLILQDMARHDFPRKGFSARNKQKFQLLQQSYAVVYGKLLQKLKTSLLEATMQSAS